MNSDTSRAYAGPPRSVDASLAVLADIESRQRGATATRPQPAYSGRHTTLEHLRQTAEHHALDVLAAAPAPAKTKLAGPLPVLPEPPGDTETASYAKRNLSVLILVSLASFGALLFSQAEFMRTSWPLFLVFGLPVIFTVGYYLISLCVNCFTRPFDLAAHHDLVRRWRPFPQPSLDVFLPVCGERPEVLRNTWSHAARMARRYPGTVTVYVLDDGASAQARAMAAEYGFAYVVRPNRGWFKKAGNLRHAFEHSQGDFILILDADFAPRADMPAQMLPYFYASPQLGIVQSPQYFRTHKRQSWTERGAGAVQELFYRTVQVSRDHHDGAICVGSCAVYRRKALESIGGTALIEHSEDVHTGFDLRRAGWGLKYIPVPLATGLCPDDPDSFITQQYRWCAGSMSLLTSRKFWDTRMRLRTRFCYLSGFCYYVQTAVFTLLAPLIPLTLLTVMPDRVRLASYLLIAPSMLYNLVIFPAWHRCRFGPAAWMAKLLYGWAHLFCLWDICRGRTMGWQPTGGAKKKSKTRRIWVAAATWNGATGIAWVAAALFRTVQYGSGNFAFILGTGLFACFIAAMGLGARRNHAGLARKMQQA